MRNKPYYLPGDRRNRNDIASLLRVNHAGEYGAVRIYQGQLKGAQNTDKKPLLQHMLEQEQEHLDSFNELINQHRTRPSALSPLWHTAGWLLGYITARLSDETAFACTEAVENTIDRHYAEQIDALEDVPDSPHQELKTLLEKFRLQELEHRDTAIEHGAHQAAAYTPLTKAIGKISELSIGLAKRI